MVYLRSEVKRGVYCGVVCQYFQAQARSNENEEDKRGMNIKEHPFFFLLNYNGLLSFPF